MTVYDPSKIRLKSVKTIEEVRDNIVGLLKCALRREDIDIDANGYALPVRFKGEESILVIRKNDDLPYTGGVYEIIIVNDKNYNQPCLHLRVYYSDQNNAIVGKIVFIRARGVGIECPIPKNQAGKWMIELSDEVFCSLGLRTNILEDDAQMPCPKAQASAKLLTLRIFQGKYQSWYETFGYVPDFDTVRVQKKYPGYTQHMFIADMKLLNSIPMDFIKEDVNSVNWSSGKFGPKSVIHQDFRKAREIINSSAGDNFGEFMSNLWQKDCSQYITVEKFFRTSSREDIDPSGDIFQWGPLWRKIEFVGYDYVKKGHC